MAVEICVGNKCYESTRKNHAEELMIGSGKHKGSFNAEMNAWPCTGERGHNCHELLRRSSIGRTITLTVTEDHGGYAANHDKGFGSTGTITYQNGEVSYDD